MNRFKSIILIRRLAAFLLLFSISSINLFVFDARSLEVRKSSEVTKTLWEVELPAQIRDIQTANGKILILGHQGERGYDGSIEIVSYMDDNGETIWEKRFVIQSLEPQGGTGEILNISLSKNGQSIIINYHGEAWQGPADMTHAESYDSNGNKKWFTIVNEPGLKLSPKGNYAVTPRISFNESKGVFKIFDNKTGNEIFSDIQKSKTETYAWYADFLSDSEVVYVKTFRPRSIGVNESESYSPWSTILSLYNIKAKGWKWQKDISRIIPKSTACFGVSMPPLPILVSSDDGIFFLGFEMLDSQSKDKYARKYLSAFDKQGNILWTRDDFETSKDGRCGGISGHSFIIGSTWLLVQSMDGTYDIHNRYNGDRVLRTGNRELNVWEFPHPFIINERLFVTFLYHDLAKTMAIDLKTGKFFDSDFPEQCFVVLAEPSTDMDDSYLIVSNGKTIRKESIKK